MAAFERPTLLHNPLCSKSRAAKALLDQRGFAYEERRYLDQPLSSDELAVLRQRLDRRAREWVRSGEEAFRKAGLSHDSSDDAVLAAMARFPILIERPIFILGDRAVVGRPPDQVLELLED